MWKALFEVLQRSLSLFWRRAFYEHFYEQRLCSHSHCSLGKNRILYWASLPFYCCLRLEGHCNREEQWQSLAMVSPYFCALPVALNRKAWYVPSHKCLSYLSAPPPLISFLGQLHTTEADKTPCPPCALEPLSQSGHTYFLQTYSTYCLTLLVVTECHTPIYFKEVMAKDMHIFPIEINMNNKCLTLLDFLCIVFLQLAKK